ncbi:MAG TPA: FeoA family protein [Phycisphaerales bacterium]|nr:FeoA family protein [Phycisphaerales bacterium]
MVSGHEAATSPSVDTTSTLSRLRPGQSGVVVDSRLSEDDAAALRAMGLRPSARIVLCRSGEPCIVRVDGGLGCTCRIGLAKPLADRVIIELSDDQAGVRGGTRRGS